MYTNNTNAFHDLLHYPPPCESTSRAQLVTIAIGRMPITTGIASSVCRLWFVSMFVISALVIIGVLHVLELVTRWVFLDNTRALAGPRLWYWGVRDNV